MSAETTSDAQDVFFMRRALRLAAKGFTPPNPMVGCVIVRDGAIVGEGFHPFAGQPHAEVFALREAGEKAKGATVYVTLEPCSHWGRTPPCADALTSAGVARVVAATTDADPRVRSRGLERLRQAGIAVTVGVLEARARRLNEAFFHFHKTQTPFITLKTAMTLDGKIATATGDSQWITSEASRRYVHLLRAQSGAVLTGIGTALADDPQLTARLPGIELPRQPLRIIVDSHLRTPPTSKAAEIARANPDFAPLLIAATESASAEREAALTCPGVEVLRLPADASGRVDLISLREALTKRRIISILTESGGELNAALIAAGLPQKALFFIAPKLLGGRDAPTPLEGAGFARMAQAKPLTSLRSRRFQGDVLLEGYFLTPRPPDAEEAA